MGKNTFVSLIERIARVAQYAKRNSYSVWWNGKEYPWDKKHGKFMRWSGGNNPYAEEPGYGGPDPLFAASGVLQDWEERGGGGAPKSAPKEEEKPSPPMTANHPTSQKSPEPIDVKTSEDFLRVVAIERSKTMSPEAAEHEKTKTREFVADLCEYITNDIKRRKLMDRHQEIKMQINEGGDIQWIDDMHKEMKEIESRYFSLEEHTDLLERRINARKKILSDKEREKNLAFLKAAFPDRGGFSFFTDTFKTNAIEGFRKLGKEKDAQYVFDVFDIIGKSFNFNSEGAQNPTLFFGKVTPSGNNSANNSGVLLEGRYDSHRRYDRYKGKYEPSTIEISDQGKHRDSLMSRFALCLGEWLNEEVLGLEQMEDNQDWLQRETGDYHTPGFGKEYTIPQEKEPFLCIEPDGSSMKVAHPHPYPESKKENHIVFSTGVFPTGLQWLAIYPEMFAIQSPKHFDQILKNFRELSVKTKKH